jgi:MGT family glycosyltransferase
MTTSKRFLFAITDAGGSVPPDSSVIRALVERGHEVRVLADRVLAPDLATTGAEHIPWTKGPQRPDLEPTSVLVRDWDAKTPQEAFVRTLDGFMTGPAGLFAADVRAELQRRPADVVVSNIFLFGAQIAAEAERVARAILIPNLFAIPGWGIPPIGPGLKPMRGPVGRLRDGVLGKMTTRLFDKGLADLNAARRANGLEPLDHTFDQFTVADRILILTSRSFEFDQYAPPSHVRFCGPRLDDPAWAEDWTPPAGGEPLVLVGLSSTFQDHGELLQRVVDGLGTLPVRGLVTSGPAIDPDSIRAPRNIEVVRSAPHSEVLKHAAAVVTHAGHGTVIKTLAAGVPQVCLPLGRDQLDNAARVQFHGAGLRLKPSAAPDTIASALKRVIDEPSFKQNARRMAAAIEADVQEDRAVAELEELATRNGDRTAATVA